jgi:hypothetical protein
MAAEVVARETDDSQFIELLNCLVRGLIARHAPQELWTIQIDNWFDHKWLGFGMGATAPALATDRYGTEKAEFYYEKPSFPPFTPNRVLSQCSYVWVGDEYREAPLPILPHTFKGQPNQSNWHRRIEDPNHSVCFVWYSAETLANGRGSVMVYNTTANGFDCWFSAFSRQQDWKLHATKGVSRGDVLQLLTEPSDR